MTLRIRRSAAGEFVVWTLSGRIERQQVAELQTLLEVEARDQRIVLDLMEVELVGRDAVRLLARCETNGIKLENCPPYIREWIQRERPGTPLD